MSQILFVEIILFYRSILDFERLKSKFKILKGQNPEFKILEEQNPEPQVLESQNFEFKILERGNPISYEISIRNTKHSNLTNQHNYLANKR